MRVVVYPDAVLESQKRPNERTGDLVSGASDVILKRDRLVALAKDLNLVAKWEAGQSQLQRFKDSAVRLLTRAKPLTPEQKLKAIVGTLEQRMFVNVDPSAGSLTLGIDWSNPQDALDIVTTMYQRFIEARYDAEVAKYAQQLQVLQIRAQMAASDVDAALAELQKLEQSRENDLAAATAAEAPGAAAGGAAAAAPRFPAGMGHRAAKASDSVPPKELEAAQSLTEIRGKIRAAEAEQNRRIAEADLQLSDARATLGPLHPTVGILTRKAETAREPMPELESLRAAEKQLVQRIAETVRPEPTPEPAQGGSPPPSGGTAAPAAPPAIRMATDLHDILTKHEDAPTTVARGKLASATSQYDDLLSRTQTSKVELDVARASFKDEYVVVRPADYPTKPKKQIALIVVVGGILGALVLFFALPGARDLLRGVLFEPWQVETQLKLTLLGDLSADGILSIGTPNDESQHD
jgi:hypothetical protein